MNYGFVFMFAAASAVACSAGIDAPPLPPPSGPGDCNTACANLQALGGCGVEARRCIDDCRSVTDAEADIGIRYPAGCLTAATSCAEAEVCR